jgi:hypothetical protein
MPNRRKQLTNPPRKPIMVPPHTHAKLLQIKHHRGISLKKQIDLWADREIAAIESEQNQSLTISTDQTTGPRGSSAAPSSGHHPATD